MFWFPRNLQREYEQLQEQHGQRGAPPGGQWESETSFSHPDEADLLAEAKLLRQHKGRLEARMHILEEHNKQLESQLHRLRQLLHQVTLVGQKVYGMRWECICSHTLQKEDMFAVAVDIGTCSCTIGLSEPCPDCHSEECARRMKDGFSFRPQQNEENMFSTATVQFCTSVHLRF